MKNVIKILGMAIVGMISFVLVGVIDIIMWAFALLNKGVRLLMWRLLKLIDGCEVDYYEVRSMSWSLVNEGYKYIVDELYPTEEDEP